MSRHEPTESSGSTDERFMADALALAGRGRGAVEPNPMVGAILARDGVELARGWHRRFGGPHAEVEAIEAARKASQDTHGATMYVTLEPCCHQAKTPPCTEAIVAAGIARVVVAMIDPDPKVAGKGVAALRAAGVQVDVGVCEARARECLAAYRKLRTTGRPWVICKWAQTADGFLAKPPGKGRWVSGRQGRAKVHQLRAESDGVLVGVGTVLADDPLLTNRSGSGRQPARLVLDSKLRTPADCQLVASAGSAAVIIATTAAGLARDAAHAEELRSRGAELLELPAGSDGRVEIPPLLDELGGRQWTYLLVEGGPQVLESFAAAGLADELLTFVSEEVAVPADEYLPHFDIADLRQRLGLGEPEIQRFGRDRMLRFVLTT